MRVNLVLIVSVIGVLLISDINTLPCKSGNRISRYVQISYEDEPLSGTCERDFGNVEEFLPAFPESGLVRGFEGENRLKRDMIGQEPRARRVKRELNWESF